MAKRKRVLINILNRQSRAQFGRNERVLLRKAAEAAFERGSGDSALLFADSGRNRKIQGTHTRRKTFYGGQPVTKKSARKINTGSTGFRRFAKGSGAYNRSGGAAVAEVNIIISDDISIRAENITHRGIDSATDVLSFPLDGLGTALETAQNPAFATQTGHTHIGDIIISAERAKKQAAEYGHGYERELAFLTVHGILHLLGYDHEGDADGEAEMNNIAEQALDKIGLSVSAPEERAPAGERFHSGFIAVIGKPNVGKSTLINAICGNGLSIVSHKPQTTRRNAKMILTTESYQLVFTDTPGLHSPKNRLGEQMVRRAKAAVKDADAIFLIIDARDRDLAADDREVLNIARASKTPVALIINKIDLIKKENLLPLIARVGAYFDFECILPVSAIKPDARETVLAEAVKLIPAGELLYPDDMITDQTERRLAEDIIREKALKLLSEEIPHGIDVEIEKFRKRERGELYDVSATIYCERESHKKIIIGKNGGMLKKIGASARVDLERMQASKVYLELWVKTRRDWRDNDAMLRRMGYSDQQ